MSTGNSIQKNIIEETGRDDYILVQLTGKGEVTYNAVEVARKFDIYYDVKYATKTETASV